MTLIIFIFCTCRRHCCSTVHGRCCAAHDGISNTMKSILRCLFVLVDVSTVAILTGKVAYCDEQEYLHKSRESDRVQTESADKD